MVANPILLGPSILTADFFRLGDQITAAEHGGADFIHFDVMDGQFVPNITIGLPVLQSLRAGTKLPIDVHLMIVEPERWVERFAKAGATSISVHVEACTHLYLALKAVAEAGATPSVAVNPGTPLSSIEEVIPIVGQILVMTVNPGFGGQEFIAPMLDKVTRLRAILDERNPECRIEVDGGIHPRTIRGAVDAGADTIVAGSAVFNEKTPVAAAIAALRRALP